MARCNGKVASAVQIDLREAARLRGPDAVDIAAVLGPLFTELGASGLDLSNVRIVCDWVQYRHNFREPVECRPVIAEPSRAPHLADGEAVTGAKTGLEIAVDLRRCVGADAAAYFAEAFGDQPEPAGVVLEPWQPASSSCLWGFNTLYWQSLSLWERCTGREYEQRLPGGRSLATDAEQARELIRELLRVWDELAARNALPEELYVVELGVGNGNQARTWLDAFVELDHRHGRDYYRRLHYLMGDYSAHVLDRALKAVAHHGERVSALVLDATRPQTTLGFLRGKAFCVYISNVYDNLPTDEVAIIHGRPYLVEVCPYLREAEAAKIAESYRIGLPELPAMIRRLLRLGPDLLAEAAEYHFAGAPAATSFWRDVWLALRLRERYVPLEGLDAYQISHLATGEMLRPLLSSCGDVRMHVSNGALTSFAETLPLLHPFGRLHCYDLFISEPAAYHAGFYGPGKYDGSVLNWVNGPLLALIGNRRGFDVQISAPAAAGHVKVLTAQVRD
jgi:hypothetical protein